MEMSRVRERLEILANVAIVVAAVVLIVGWIKYGANAPVASSLPPQVEPGDILTGVDIQDQLFVGTEASTLLVYVNSSCRYCGLSMPFYGKLVEAHRAESSTVDLVFASREPLAQLKEYLESNGVHAPRIFEVPIESNFAQYAVPAVLLVDKHRHIVEKWQGILELHDEAEVLAAATAGTVGG